MAVGDGVEGAGIDYLVGHAAIPLKPENWSHYRGCCRFVATGWRGFLALIGGRVAQIGAPWRLRLRIAPHQADTRIAHQSLPSLVTGSIGIFMKRILVVRNDKIGDFMLAWPSFAMLKRSMECHVTALVPRLHGALWPASAHGSTRSSWIPVPADKGAATRLLARIKAAAFDASMLPLLQHPQCQSWCGRRTFPYRLAPATKLAQVLYNQRLVQRRPAL